MFLKISQKSHGKTCARVSFLITLHLIYISIPFRDTFTKSSKQLFLYWDVLDISTKSYPYVWKLQHFKNNKRNSDILIFGLYFVLAYASKQRINFIPLLRFFFSVLCQNWKLNETNYTVKYKDIFKCNYTNPIFLNIW